MDYVVIIKTFLSNFGIELTDLRILEDKQTLEVSYVFAGKQQITEIKLSDLFEQLKIT